MLARGQHLDPGLVRGEVGPLAVHRENAHAGKQPPPQARTAREDLVRGHRAKRPRYTVRKVEQDQPIGAIRVVRGDQHPVAPTQDRRQVLSAGDVEGDDLVLGAEQVTSIRPRRPDAERVHPRREKTVWELVG